MTLRIKERVDTFNTQQLTSIAKILADTTNGLTGSQIEHILQDCRMKDVSPDMTKWKRLCNAFVACQDEHRIGNHVVMFITRAMNPVQYTGSRDAFNARRDELNAVLAFCGMEVGDDGKVRRASRAANLCIASRADIPWWQDVVGCPQRLWNRMIERLIPLSLDTAVDTGTHNPCYRHRLAGEPRRLSCRILATRRG